MSSKTVEVFGDGTKALGNPNREKFCLLFATDNSIFGCGTDAYIRAFDVDTTKPKHRLWCGVEASKLLKNPIVLGRINYLLETRLGLSDSEADKQLAFLITQSADMRVKLGAIREYNALKGRVKKKLELSFVDSSDEEVTEELKAIEEELEQATALLASRRASGAQETPGMPTLTESQIVALNEGQIVENGLQKPKEN